MGYFRNQLLVKQLISEKAADLRIGNWPGPIAQLVLGQINEDEFQNRIRTPGAQDARDRQWLAGFYKSLILLQQGAGPGFSASMCKLADTDQSEWQDEGVLLSRIWNEEFFLARFVAETSEGTPCA